MNVGLLGAAVERRRVALGWQQKELARRAGVSPSYVCRLESGFMHEVGLGRLDAVASALGCAVPDLLKEASAAARLLPAAA